MKKEKIRKAKRTDAMIITRLFNSSTAIFGTRREEENYSEKDIKDYLRKKSRITIVYEIDGIIAGVLLAEFFKEYAHIEVIIIRKAYRRCGIGKKLFHFIEQEAKIRGINLIELLTENRNVKMKHFLKKEGYKKGQRFLFYSKKL